MHDVVRDSLVMALHVEQHGALGEGAVAVQYAAVGRSITDPVDEVRPQRHDREPSVLVEVPQFVETVQRIPVNVVFVCLVHRDVELMRLLKMHEWRTARRASRARSLNRPASGPSSTRSNLAGDMQIGFRAVRLLVGQRSSLAKPCQLERQVFQRVAQVVQNVADRGADRRRNLAVIPEDVGHAVSLVRQLPRERIRSGSPEVVDLLSQRLNVNACPLGLRAPRSGRV